MTGNKEIKEDIYKEYKDEKGNFIMCPICQSKTHFSGECEQYQEDYL